MLCIFVNDLQHSSGVLKFFINVLSGFESKAASILFLLKFCAAFIQVKMVCILALAWMQSEKDKKGHTSNSMSNFRIPTI